MKDHLCKTCGESDSDKFYKNKKYICKICRNIQTKQYREENIENISNQKKEYNRKNADIISKQRLEYRKENTDRIKDKNKRYYLNNTGKVLEQQKEYKKEKRNSEPSIKFIENLRRRQRHVIRGRNSTTDGLGCNRKELAEYLFSKFTDGMNMDNYGKGNGKWNIDHILPLSSFIKDENGNWCVKSEYNRRLIHYTNLQPLWEEDNLEKSNKI